MRIFQVLTTLSRGDAVSNDTLAIQKLLKDNGINYQKKMEVVAQDLDWLGVFMSYVQFSFLGINAIVAQGDTLMEPYVKGYPEARVFRTPANKGVLI